MLDSLQFTKEGKEGEREKASGRQRSCRVGGWRNQKKKLRGRIHACSVTGIDGSRVEKIKIPKQWIR